MIFPEFLRHGDTIGVTALSHGIEDEIKRVRFRSGKHMLEERGYRVQFTENVFVTNDRFGRSSSAKEKAEQFHTLAADPSVRAIYSASGGDFLAEMLSFVDLEAFRTDPKWVQGFSDNTSILYYLTTKGGVATAYGANFADFGMQPWQRSVTDGLEVLEGKRTVQTSFDAYQNGFGDYVTGLEGYSADAPVRWDNLIGGNEIVMRGRLLGGCLDVLMNIAGTPYDGTLDFIEQYKDDGILWFLESFDLGFEQMMESLWKMKEMGWFRHTVGILFGRPLFYADTAHDGTPLPTYAEVLHERLDELGVPVVLNADVGHRGPQFVMINGALAEIRSADGRGSCTYLDLL